MKNLIPILAIASLIYSCRNSEGNKKDRNIENKVTEIPNIKIVRERVLSAEDQKMLKPDSVILSLKNGNLRFVNNDLTARDHSAMVRNASMGQYPKAVILSCVDSRIPVEDIFDKGIGDMFVARVAGNFVNVDILGSMEFGCKVSGAKLILVLGHQNCGAIKAAIDNVKMGNISEMLTKIQPAVNNAHGFNGEQTSKNADFVNYISEKNVLHTIEMIRANSPILKEMEEKGEIKIAGGFYNLKTGVVTFL